MGKFYKWDRRFIGTCQRSYRTGTDSQGIYTQAIGNELGVSVKGQIDGRGNEEFIVSVITPVHHTVPDIHTSFVEHEGVAPLWIAYNHKRSSGHWGTGNPSRIVGRYNKEDIDSSVIRTVEQANSGIIIANNQVVRHGENYDWMSNVSNNTERSI